MFRGSLKNAYMTHNNQFYRQYYHWMIIALMILIVLLLIALFVAFYQITYRPLPLFYAKSTSGKEMNLMAFNEPNLLPNTILRFASKAATLAYTFDFVNYNKQIEAVSPYFTDAGFRDYRNAVNSLINTVVTNQLFVNGVVSGAPVIVNQGPLPETTYAWRVQIPFLVTYQSANTISKQDYFVVMTIIKVPTNINPQGIGISQFLMV